MFWIFQIAKLGIQSLLLHKLRSTLAVLGIIFGVCSVIAMLSIGEGASQEAQEQIRLLGTNNIIVRAVKPPQEARVAAQSRLSEYGLTQVDFQLIEETIPGVESSAPMRDLRQDVRHLDRRSDAKIIGTVPEYLGLTSLRVERGRFLNVVDHRLRANVCVLGSAVVPELFGYHDPLGKDIKIGSDYYRVVGVLEKRSMPQKGQHGIAVDYSRDIYIPLSAARARIGEITMKVTSGSREFEKVELHQIHVRARDMAEVPGIARAIQQILQKTHTKADYELVVPLELLRQAEETKRIFNIVLGCIAGISLLVGGIGIMNIMLATVTERTREIGIRRALGAKRGDITLQFLVETMVLTSFGGFLGILLGVIVPGLVTRFAGMRTIVTLESLVLAFGISAAAGILFGLYPAWRAAYMDPIEALRHE